MTFSGHTSSINSLAWSPDETKFATGSADRTARVWSIEHNSSSLLICTGHKASVSQVWWQDNITIIAGASDNSQRAWILTPSTLSSEPTRLLPPATLSSECPAQLEAPICPAGTLACSSKFQKYCYYPDRDIMLSTYFVPEYDFCPNDQRGKANGSIPFQIGGINVWQRVQGKDSSECIW
jgi:WD40 repeat protein